MHYQNWYYKIKKMSYQVIFVEFPLPNQLKNIANHVANKLRVFSLVFRFHFVLYHMEFYAFANGNYVEGSTVNLPT